MKRIRDMRKRGGMESLAGSDGLIWHLLMGEQMHLGGMPSSGELADASGISGLRCGVDLCCGVGASMRFLVRWRGVNRMLGVDMNDHIILRGHERSVDEKMEDRISFVHADACETGLPDACADFAWGEDGWCFIEDKQRLIDEAARLIKTGGRIAFTDWLEVPGRLSNDEARRMMGFMKFPSLASIDEYREMLEGAGCEMLLSEDTGGIAPSMSLFMEMLTRQHRFDALGILNFDERRVDALVAEMAFIRGLAEAGKLAHGRFVARKKHG